MENKWKLLVPVSDFFPYKERFVMIAQLEIKRDLKMNSKIYHQFPEISLISQLIFLYKMRISGEQMETSCLRFLPYVFFPLEKALFFFVLFISFRTVTQFAKIAKFEIKKIKIELKSLYFHQVDAFTLVVQLYNTLLLYVNCFYLYFS